MDAKCNWTGGYYKGTENEEIEEGIEGRMDAKCNWTGGYCNGTENNEIEEGMEGWKERRKGGMK